VKDIALQVARERPSLGLHIMREYIQNYVLWLMQREDLNTQLFFMGGTALRFLWRIGRCSEDLDFSAGPDWEPEEFTGAMRKIENSLAAAGYNVDLHLGREKAVQRAVFRFAELLAELGLVGRREQKLSIALEIDTKPPGGATGAKTLVNLHIPVLIQHHDLPSLLAGKAAAVLTREYIKGRDYFDLFWFLSKWPDLEPNPLMFRNALTLKRDAVRERTKEGGPRGRKTADGADKSRIGQEKNWRAMLRRAVDETRWPVIETDVRAFIEDPDSLLAFTKENLLRLLNRD
jgi:predicted nucleotidyltransferase component of viral defense system